ncbi:MAG TPA: endonuclease/exonuclease/phosphatase family protein [Rubrobacteraceae bacterium]|nr:endonuclease/exonuclease/phosphatase family protein [Rubrobacteraceae bacterium]
MPEASLTVVTYNTSQEQKGRDPALDDLLREEGIVVCLQEVNPARALRIKRSSGSRSFVSLGKYGLLYLAIVLPEGARFLERRTASLNGYGGYFPQPWSLRRSYELYRAGRPAWRDGLEPRVAQVVRVLWGEREFRLVNTHLPYESGLRNRCLELLPGFLDAESVLLTGDLNATTQNPFLADFLLETGLRPAGTEEPTHDSGRKVDIVLYRGGFREVGYGLTKSLSDHRLVRVELEV